MRPIEILLAEGDPAAAEVTEAHLRAYHVPIHVHSVPDGDAVLAWLRRSPPHADAARPDILILDLDLPGRDGRAVLEALKADPELAGIPVMILTGSTAEEDVLRSYALKADCFLRKPRDRASFEALARSVEELWFTAVLPARYR